MRLCLSGLLFLFVISLPSGNGLFGNDGVEVRTCTALGGRCFFGCRIGWKWVAYCHNVLSCCLKLRKHPPPQANEP
ncbi:defensin beta 136 [Orcinus orca]|uniref:defensin beta 136 n=1 Tax=Sagmatias obliquidens TaxID=3371155 RepID=UPI0002BCEDCF|nr:beta-defensin 136 [Lagenorhynchus obliquidens]XP_030735116.1 defensin beta 136 [Globicephala melas]XP_033259428.1 defensin beta 136 [Orcinus orca]